MGALVTPLPALILLFQNPIHGADRTVMHFFIQERGPHLPGWTVLKTLTVQHIQHLVAFLLAQGPMMFRRMRRAGLTGRLLAAAIEAAPAHAQGCAGPFHRNLSGQFFNSGVHDCSSFAWLKALSKACASFFWAPIISSACSNWLRSRVFS